MEDPKDYYKTYVSDSGNSIVLDNDANADFIYVNGDEERGTYQYVFEGWMRANIKTSTYYNKAIVVYLDGKYYSYEYIDSNTLKSSTGAICSSTSSSGNNQQRDLASFVASQPCGRVNFISA